MARMLMNCTTEAYAVNKSRMVRLAEYSRDCLIELRADTGISYDERTQGTLQLFRTEKQVAAAEKDIAVLKADGVPFEVLDAEAALRPSRGWRRPTRSPAGCACRGTRRAIASSSPKPGRHGGGGGRHLPLRRRRSTGWRPSGGRITAVHTSEGRSRPMPSCWRLGPIRPRLAAPFGIKLPVYPVKGYSITVPITDEARAPVSTVMDETHKIAITRLGDRIRVGGMAEIAGFDMSPEPQAAGHADPFGRGPVRRRGDQSAGPASGAGCAR
jgi:D-amino-acid dehydrogenase